MFSGTSRLGEQHDETHEMDERSDVDFIAANFLSPDPGYPPQRISNYDEQLQQHQTLNGNNMSRLVAPRADKWHGPSQRTLGPAAPRTPSNFVPRYTRDACTTRTLLSVRGRVQHGEAPPWLTSLRTAMGE